MEIVNTMKSEIEKAKDFVKGKESVKAIILEVQKMVCIEFMEKTV